MDWLRVLALLGVFLVHCALPFSGGDWIVTNNEAHLLAALFAGLFNQFGLPLLFLISGAGIYYALCTRNILQFAVERIKRLGIPFIFGILVFSPVQGYFHARVQDSFDGTLFHYLPQFFRSPLLISRDFRWIGMYDYHLWFLLCLLFFSFLTPLIFFYMRHNPQITNRLASLMYRPGGVFLMAIPLIVIQGLFRPRHPTHLGLADVSFWLMFFIYGYVLVTHRYFFVAVKRDLKLAFSVFVTTAIVIAGIYLRGELGSEPHMAVEHYPHHLFFLSMATLNSWSLILLLLGIGIRWLDVPHQYISTATQATLPFYLLHHPPVVVIGFFVTQWSIPIGFKFLILTFGSLIVTLILYEFLVRRSNIFRLLFGMRLVS